VSSTFVDWHRCFAAFLKSLSSFSVLRHGLFVAGLENWPFCPERTCGEVFKGGFRQAHAGQRIASACTESHYYWHRSGRESIPTWELYRQTYPRAAMPWPACACRKPPLKTSRQVRSGKRASFLVRPTKRPWRKTEKDESDFKKAAKHPVPINKSARHDHPSGFDLSPQPDSSTPGTKKGRTQSGGTR